MPKGEGLAVRTIFIMLDDLQQCSDDSDLKSFGADSTRELGEIDHELHGQGDKDDRLNNLLI